MRGRGAVPEAVPGILPYGAKGVLCVLPRLALVEERHDLAHHHAHRILTPPLGDRDQTHAVLGQLADVEVELELVAEEPREAVHHDDGGGAGQCLRRPPQPEGRGAGLRRPDGSAPHRVRQRRANLLNRTTGPDSLLTFTKAAFGVRNGLRAGPVAPHIAATAVIAGDTLLGMNQHCAGSLPST